MPGDDLTQQLADAAEWQLIRPCVFDPKTCSTCYGSC